MMKEEIAAERTPAYTQGQRVWPRSARGTHDYEGKIQISIAVLQKVHIIILRLRQPFFAAPALFSTIGEDAS
jgi:hypothetical protein